MSGSRFKNKREQRKAAGNDVGPETSGNPLHAAAPKAGRAQSAVVALAATVDDDEDGMYGERPVDGAPTPRAAELSNQLLSSTEAAMSQSQDADQRNSGVWADMKKDLELEEEAEAVAKRRRGRRGKKKQAADPCGGKAMLVDYIGALFSEALMILCCWFLNTSTNSMFPLIFLIMTMLQWGTSLSQFPKYVSTDKHSVTKSVRLLKRNLTDSFGGANAAELSNIDIEVARIHKVLSWHARMVIAPIVMTGLIGLVFHMTTFSVFQHYAGHLHAAHGCSSGLLDLMSNMPTTSAVLVVFASLFFLLSLYFLLRLSRRHFRELELSYSSWFQKTQMRLRSQGLRAQTGNEGLDVDEQGRTYQESVFNEVLMWFMYTASIGSQTLLLTIFSLVTNIRGEDGAMDSAGLITFFLLTLERFLVGMQYGILFEYKRHSKNAAWVFGDTAFTVEQKERMIWHRGLVLHTSMLGAMQCFVFLPSLMSATPFFAPPETNNTITSALDDTTLSVTVTVVESECAGLSLFAKMDSATGSQIMIFISCVVLGLVTFGSQAWLSRTHFVQFIHYRRESTRTY